LERLEWTGGWPTCGGAPGCGPVEKLLESSVMRPKRARSQPKGVPECILAPSVRCVSVGVFLVDSPTFPASPAECQDAPNNCKMSFTLSRWRTFHHFQHEPNMWVSCAGICIFAPTCSFCVPRFQFSPTTLCDPGGIGPNFPSWAVLSSQRGLSNFAFACLLRINPLVAGTMLRAHSWSGWSGLGAGQHVPPWRCPRLRTCGYGEAFCKV